MKNNMEDQEEEKSLLYVCAGKCGKDLSKEEFTSSQWAKGATHRKCIHCTGGAPRVASARLRTHLVDDDRSLSLGQT